MNSVYEQLKKDALYAQQSYSTELLYQAHGAAQMARQLGAISREEAMTLNDMTVRFMNTDQEYIRHKNEEFARLAHSTGDVRDSAHDLPEKIKVTISREDGDPLFSRDQDPRWSI